MSDSGTVPSNSSNQHPPWLSANAIVQGDLCKTIAKYFIRNCIRLSSASVFVFNRNSVARRDL